MAGTSDAPEEGSPQRAARQLGALCREHAFRGVVLDMDGPPSPFLSELIPELDQTLERLGRGLFLPLDYARWSRRAFLFLSASLSGGSLRERLEKAAEAWGPKRLVLALERTAEEFPLPAPEGEGKPLTREALEELLRRLRPQVHDSAALCARYFTYLDRESRPRLVLFDQGDSLKRKRSLAESVGIERVFLLYPQIRDLLEDTENPFLA